MPAEIHEPDLFVDISRRAEYCAVKRLKDVVKLKLRTSSKLYTLKALPEAAEDIIRRLECEIREI